MMNKVQKNYMVAKAVLQTYEEMETDIEKKYISENGIKKEDGEVPARVYCIDNEAVFDKANEDTVKIIQESGYYFLLRKYSSSILLSLKKHIQTSMFRMTVFLKKDKDVYLCIPELWKSIVTVPMKAVSWNYYLFLK